MHDASEIQPFVVHAGDGRTIQGPVGGPITFLCTAAQSGGALTVFENTVAPGQGPPLHTHDVETETWYVLAGQARFQLGTDIQQVSTGGFVCVPPKTPHCFHNCGDTPLRILVMFSPAGMEDFFERFAGIDPSEVSPQLFATLGVPNGMTVIGPPL